MDLSSSLSWFELKRNQRNGILKPEQSQIFVAPRAMVEIYDLKKDPNELENVADRLPYAIDCKKWAKLLVDWQKETRDHPGGNGVGLTKMIELRDSLYFQE